MTSPDPVRPDPATRDLLAEILGHLSGPTTDHRWDEYGEFVRTPWLRADQVHTWGQKLAALQDPPPLPDEPPNLAALAGYGGDTWKRIDGKDGINEDGYAQGSWWLAGSEQDHSWAEAHVKGAAPGRRLVELAPTQMIVDAFDVSGAIGSGRRHTHSVEGRASCSECVSVDRLREALRARALAERGNQQ